MDGAVMPHRHVNGIMPVIERRANIPFALIPTVNVCLIIISFSSTISSYASIVRGLFAGIERGKLKR